MGQMKREARKSGIIQAAMEIALRDGLGAVTVRAVAKSLGVSPGQIHHNFESISEIKAEALRAAVLKISSPTSDSQVSGTPHQRLLQLLAGDQRRWDVQAASLWNEALYIARQDRYVASTLNELVLAWIDQITTVIGDGQASGHFRVSGCPEEIANRLAVTVMGLDRFGALNNQTYNLLTIQARIREAIERECG